MAHSFRTATQNSSSTGTAISVSAPTGTVAGDLVKVIVHANGQTTIVDNNKTVSIANLVQGQDTTDDSDSTVASANYVVGRLYLLTLCSRTDATQPTISSITAPTGSGIVWTLVDNSDFDASGSRRTVFVYRGVATASVTSGFTITWGQTQTAKTWNVDEITNADISGTQGANAIVQVVKNTGASVTSLTVTLGSFASTSNATYGAFGNAGEGALTAGSGFTRYGNQQVSGEAGLGTIFKSTNDTSVDMSGSTMDIGGIAIEIKSNSGFTEEINDYKPNTSSGHTMSVFSRVIQSGDPTTYNFTSGASGRWAVIAICATDTATPVDDVAPSTTNATNRDSSVDGTAVTASINTGVNNAYHIVVAGWDTGAIGTITTPSGYTLLANANGGGNPTHASYKLITSAGATGTTNIVNTEFGAYITFSFSVKDGAAAFTSRRLALLGIGS